MNQQLINENRFLKEEISNFKGNALKLIEENTNLNNELKNVTIHEILNELHNDKSILVGDLVK
jgi:regulator of replication initiation timing